MILALIIGGAIIALAFIVAHYIDRKQNRP